MTKRQIAAHITQQDADTMSQGPPAHVTEGMVSLYDLNILFLLTIQIPQKKKKRLVGNPCWFSG